MKSPVDTLRESGYRVYFASYSALDRYFRVPSSSTVHLLTDASLVGLAGLFDHLEYAGGDSEDAAVPHGGRAFRLRCYDEEVAARPRAFTVQELLYDPGRDVFLDPEGIYTDLRSGGLIAQGSAKDLDHLAEAAILVSRYPYSAEPETLLVEPPASAASGAREGRAGTLEFQRDLLLSVLAGRRPDKGLALLSACGFVERYWPELQRMAAIPHHKDYHPEGDGWQHTLETFKHRKDEDPVLSLALLLHDVGKPEAASTPERAFDGHAELGAQIATHFLRRLGFPEAQIRDVTFLVRHHMMPAALKELPLYRSERIMDCPLFPLLLELYRADMSASYWSPSGYYEACQVYRNYRKHKANPFRRNDGTKRGHRARNRQGPQGQQGAWPLRSLN
jgi:poly(A) polymerase